MVDVSRNSRGRFSCQIRKEAKMFIFFATLATMLELRRAQFYSGLLPSIIMAMPLALCKFSLDPPCCSERNLWFSPTV